VAGLVLVVTAPWWGTVLAHNGVTPFIAAGKTGGYSVKGILQIFQSNLTHEFSIQTIGPLALLGLFWHAAQRKYFVPVWTLVIFFSEPTSAPLFLSPCLAILASSSLIGILQIFNEAIHPPKVEVSDPNPLSSRASRGLFIVLSGLWIISAMVIIIVLQNSTTLTSSDKMAFDWIKFNTSNQSKFLVLTGGSPFTDPASEWFPALTDRISIATVQGYEWDAGKSLDEIFTESVDVQNCINQTFQCVQSWVDKNHFGLNYLYIHNPVRQTDPQTGVSFTSALGTLSVSQGYTELVYQNDDVSIYKVK
jgi:hypothetical protein